MRFEGGGESVEETEHKAFAKGQRVAHADPDGKRNEDEDEVFALQGEVGTALQIFECEEDGRGEGGEFPEAAHGEVGDCGDYGEEEEVENADAKRTEVAEDAEDVVGEKTSGHLEVEEVFVGDVPVLHEEGFVEERSFVVRDGPLKRECRLCDKQGGKQDEEDGCDALKII